MSLNYLPPPAAGPRPIKLPPTPKGRAAVTASLAAAGYTATATPGVLAPPAAPPPAAAPAPASPARGLLWLGAAVLAVLLLSRRR